MTDAEDESEIDRQKEIKILLVDDSHVVRMVIARQLEVLGLVVDTAADGLLAVKAVSESEKDYDLILMDVMMPVMDGMEATKQIRAVQKERAAKQPVIVGVTGYTNRSECLDAGMDDFLFKPVTIEQLKGVLKQWLPQASLLFGMTEEKVRRLI
ncbi:MAG: response regulator [Cyanobacteria bacterium SZAS LIN-2]|nr:response regulator [Cyanobacteria bacterium SZAS LIN-3]MBS1994709.1 response regulator [Cyanobacteria bacterium SZAS LIN-2]